MDKDRLSSIDSRIREIESLISSLNEKVNSSINNEHAQQFIDERETLLLEINSLENEKKHLQNQKTIKGTYQNLQINKPFRLDNIFYDIKINPKAKEFDMLLIPVDSSGLIELNLNDKDVNRMISDIMTQSEYSTEIQETIKKKGFNWYNLNDPNKIGILLFQTLKREILDDRGEIMQDSWKINLKNALNQEIINFSNKNILLFLEPVSYDPKYVHRLKESFEVIEYFSDRIFQLDNNVTFTFGIEDNLTAEQEHELDIELDYLITGKKLELQSNFSVELIKIKTKILNSKDKEILLFQRPSINKTNQSTDGLLYANFNNYAKSPDNKHEDVMVLVYEKDKHNITYLYEVLFETIGIDTTVKALNKIYEFKDDIRWQDLNVDLYTQHALNEMFELDDETIQTLTYKEFIALIDVTELGPLIKIEQGPQIIQNPLKSTTLNNDGAFAKVDLLGFENDIRAFATMMALKETKPPLAIALFGDWGTGKSFFMNKLEEKIAYLAQHQGFPIGEEAYEKELDIEEKPFCEGIAQIKFNAWSYLDANLWAGLVVNIFEKLDEYIDNNAKKGAAYKIRAQKALSDKLAIVAHEKETLLTKEKELGEEIKGIDDTLTKLIEEKDNIYNKVIDKSLNDLINIAKEKTTPLANNVKDELLTQGITQEKIDKLSPKALYDEAASWFTFVKNLFKFSRKQLFLYGLIVIVLFFIVLDPGGLVTKSLNKTWEALLVFIGIIGPIFQKVYSVFNRYKNFLSPLTEYKNQFNKSFEETKLEYEKSLSTLEKETSEKQKEIEEIQSKKQIVNEQIEHYQYELEHSLTKRAFFNFIKEKAHDQSYQNYLGLISIIRKDFEVLSELFEEVIIPKNISKEEKEKLEKRKKENKEFKRLFDKPLDRIILYIDDLDRCPDEKVMEVLQAVHLLMAFPMFIVVVGVDKRCVYNALNYKNLVQYSKYTESKHPEDLEEFGINIIQPHEYLEKIFQIPFHLKEASDDEVKFMINNLLKDQIEIPIKDDKRKQEIGEEAKEEVKPEPETEEQHEKEVLADKTTETRIKHRLVPKEEEISKPIVEKIKHIKPEDLKISKDEMKYLQEISWLVGHAPRTIKRFINMYRIIRAHEQLNYNEEEKNDDFLTIMFILGLAIGCHKQYANDVFDGFIGNNQFSLSTFLSSSNELNDIKDQLEKSEKTTQLLTFQNEQFKKFIPFVRRFSFGSDNHGSNKEENEVTDKKANK